MKEKNIFLITNMRENYDNEENYQGYTEEPMYAFDSKKKLNEYLNSKNFGITDYCIYEIILNDTKSDPEEIYT